MQDLIQLHRDGVLVYEPLYGAVTAATARIQQLLDIGGAMRVESWTLGKLLGEVVLGGTLFDTEFAILVLPLLLSLVPAALEGRLYRGIRERATTTAGVTVTVTATKQ